MFKEFSKTERTEDRNQEGIGIGLVVCQKIVEKCGGSIQAFSAGENMGATFSFTMAMKLTCDIDLSSSSSSFVEGAPSPDHSERSDRMSFVEEIT